MLFFFVFGLLAKRNREREGELSFLSKITLLFRLVERKAKRKLAAVDVRKREDCFLSIFPSCCYTESRKICREKEIERLLVFYIGNILVDKNTLCNSCF
jgi:hypothetical protein